MLNRQEDKEIRRISKKVNLDPMIDEDSDGEEYLHSSPADLVKSSRASPKEQARRPRTLDLPSAACGTKAALVPATREHTPVTASVGSALRRNVDGNITAPKILPKRNKGSKVNQALYLLPNHWLTIASFLATKLEAKGKRTDTPSGRF